LSRAQHVAESVAGQFRDGCPNQRWFASLEEARHTIEAWRLEYNTEHPIERSDSRTRRPG
jgi:hypothetical protein